MNAWQQWLKQELAGLLLYTMGDLREALSIMRLIHPLMQLPFHEDQELQDAVDARVKQLQRGEPDKKEEKNGSA